ncbi:MAG: histidine kinase [Saprospiraceae bacterium]|nr:histidine kinase [Saprospiraceae bacterium]
MRLVLLLLLPFHLAAQSPQFTAWSLEAGLPQSQVYAMCEDLHGYLWIGTQGGGVCRFDGMGFEVFTMQEGLPSNFISALYEDQSGRIWVGANEGAAVWDGRQFQKIAFPEPLTVYAFLQTETEHLLLGTSRGVWQYTFKTRQLAKIPLHPLLDKTPVYCLQYAAQKRTVWLGTLQGLWYFPLQNRQASQFNKKAGIAVLPVAAITQTDDFLWASQTGGPLLGIDRDRQTLKTTQPLPPVGSVTCLLGDTDQSLWIGTLTLGLLHLQPGNDSSATQLTEADGLPHNHLRVLLRDHAGRMWIGTSGGGFACMVAQAFRRYDRDDGLPGNRIYAVHETRAGEIWMAVSQNGLARIDSLGRVHRFAADSSYLQGVKCRTIGSDPSGNIWVGTEGKGALVMMPGRWRLFRKDNGMLPSDWVQKIVCHPDGTVWLATGLGVVSLKWNAADSTFSKRWYDAEEGVPPGTITALQMDAQNTVWFGTQYGKIGRIRNGAVEVITANLPNVPITAIVFDASGQCRIGTKGAGVFTADPRKNNVFTALSTPAPLSSQNIYLLAFDRSGRLWAGTETGVDQIEEEKGSVTAVHHFGKQEGFSGIETCQDAALCDRSGRMWFGTMNGLMRYIPNATTRKSAPPVLHFEQVSLFYKPITETKYGAEAALLFNGTEGGLPLPWNQNHLSFSFRAIELMHSEPLQYRWRLEGPDADWSPWSEQTQVNYANLAPGTYRLWIQAGSGPDALSPPMSAAFTIRKPFWESWYFRLAALLLLGAGVYAGVRTYVGGIREEEHRRREQLEMQNRLLQLEQKALQLQMNPHFIFNALNSIQSLIATRDYEVARQEINRFAKLMRGILNNSRKASITLQEEIDTLEQYLSVEQFCQQNPFTFAIHVAENIDTGFIDIPPMLLQPFVENAVVHGVSHLNYPGHIDLFFELVGEMLVCRITDNGAGREQAALLREARKPGHQSIAVSVTQERLAAIGGKIQYRDLQQGTEVAIEVPVGKE